MSLPKKKKIVEIEELPLSLFTKTENEIAKEYSCSRSTISRIKRKIRESTGKFLKDIIREDYAVFFKSFLDNSSDRLHELRNMRKNSEDNLEKLEIMKSERAEGEYFLKILKDGPIVDALEKLEARQDE